MEEKEMTNLIVKAVEDTNPDTIDTPQSKEAAVLEKAIEDGEVSPEYGLQDDGVYKVNLDEPPKEEKDAIQVGETKEEVLRNEGPEVGLPSVGSEVRETPEDAKDVEEVTQAEIEGSPLELVKEEEETADTIQEEETIEEIVQKDDRVLPEDVDKLVQFMEDTGGTVSDYANLNRDVSKIDNVSLIREYYEFTKPHLDKEDVDFLMDKNFAYDKELDEASDIRAKQLAFKEELYNAKNKLKDIKDKYYTDLKLRKKDNVSDEYKKALAYYNRTQQLIKEGDKSKQVFKKETDKIFNDNFKGFDFNVGENKYKFKIENPKKVQNFQSDINNFLNQFKDKDGVQDTGKYHKALFAAQNADKIANHFYEQGRADAIKDSAKQAKNINMDPRSNGPSVTTQSGDKIRVVSGDSSDKLRIKWK